MSKLKQSQNFTMKCMNSLASELLEGDMQTVTTKLHLQTFVRNRFLNQVFAFAAALNYSNLMVKMTNCQFRENHSIN